MAKEKPAEIKVKAFGTHYVITQPNPLRKVLRRRASHGAKTENDIVECIARWWCLVQPADRAVARPWG